MKAWERRNLFVRVSAEFLAIFAGVVLALTADGWAERRAEERGQRRASDWSSEILSRIPHNLSSSDAR